MFGRVSGFDISFRFGPESVRHDRQLKLQFLPERNIRPDGELPLSADTTGGSVNVSVRNFETPRLSRIINIMCITYIKVIENGKKRE
jgi:hypothetical protein